MLSETDLSSLVPLIPAIYHLLPYLRASTTYWPGNPSINLTSSQLVGSWRRKFFTYAGIWAMPSGISTKCWEPDKNITDKASSNAAVVCRLIRGILYKHVGVKSIGSKVLRVNGSIVVCVGSSL